MPQFNSRANNLAHPVIQSMAVTMSEYDYYDLKTLYRSLRLGSSPNEEQIRQWRQDGLIIGNQPSTYNRNHRIKVSGLRWADVMRTIPPTVLPRRAALWPSSTTRLSNSIIALSRAVVKCLHNESFASDLEEIDFAKISYCESVVTLLSQVIAKRDLAPVMKQLDYSLLAELFFQRYENNWAQLRLLDDSETLRTVFFENPLIPEDKRQTLKDIYTFYIDLQTTGRLDDVIEKVSSDTGIQDELLSYKLMHDGQPDRALTLLNKQLKNLRRKYCLDALTNFVYALALVMSKTKQATKAADQLLNSESAHSDDRCYAMLVVLHHMIQGDVAKFLENYPLDSCTNKMSYYLACLAIRHYQMLTPEPHRVAQAALEIKSSPYNYLKRLYCEDFSELKDDARQLIQQTGLKNSLLPTGKRVEPWEVLIDNVLRLSSTSRDTGKGGRALERIAYLVDLDDYSVQPKLQKSNDGGKTWSKGRNIALKSFGSESCATPQDIKVSKLVNSYGQDWYGYNVQYKLEGEQVIAALAGCQSVYDQDTLRRIEITEVPLQLQVLESGSGYVVKTNVDPDNAEAGCSITMTDSRHLTVTHLDNTQLAILRMLRNTSFPSKSRKRLTELLENLSDRFVVMSPLLKNGTDLKRVPANTLIALQVKQEQSDTFLVEPVVKPFGNCPPQYSPGKGIEIVSTTIDGERVQTERDLAAERKHLQELEAALDGMINFDTDSAPYQLDTAHCLQLLECVRAMPNVAYLEWPHGQQLRVVRPPIGPDQLHLKVYSSGQWFEVEGTLRIGEKETIKMAKLLDQLDQAIDNFIPLTDDEYVALSEQMFKQLQSLNSMSLARGNKLRLAQTSALQLNEFTTLGSKLTTDPAFKRLAKRIHEASTLQIALPSNLQAQLRPYQVEGFKWLSRLAHWGGGACLADDMGLGKTLQAIAVMQARSKMGPQLVLMPTSVLLNWQQELERFAPTLHVQILNRPGTDRAKLVNAATSGDVVLSTYGLVVTEAELLASQHWTTIVLDEAHTIKNHHTLTSKGCMSLTGDFRILLTGTPLQNHLSEIWNLFEFANPGLLGSYTSFTKNFILPIERDHDKERQQLLRRILSPFMLRRTKEDVLSDLPEKSEITLSVELSDEEQALYETMRLRALANLEGQDVGVVQTLAEITRLRQAACHPRLVNDMLTIQSSKMQAFLELVDNLTGNSHRALVFSQFTSHLALAREELDKRHIAYLYLDGSTPAAERTRLVKQYQTDDTPLFLISLKAGGLGLNLTAADYVIHLDPWWNPAIEDQASDRAHRIGQTRPVTVYRLIAAGTIEDKILRLHNLKRNMADALLQDANLFSQISAEDVIKLLRERASDIQ
ncbi:MAG: DEAD/DEAH box helicase [Muribaculaceae bacterium]|nr:DEAD/DEAH box helicase [Muribaculaceae bacterium]